MDWQPIATAPKDVLVLCYSAEWDCPVIALTFRSDEWRDDSGDSYQDYQPTHWQPLPPAPAETV